MITLTVTDDDGNTVNTTATVTVEDNEVPTIVAQDITVQLDGTGNIIITPAQVDNGSADNCAANLSLDITAFDCTDLGANLVTLTVRVCRWESLRCHAGRGLGAGSF